MATFGALRPPWHPYRTQVLCPPNLCPDLCLKAKVAGLLSLQMGAANSGKGEARLAIRRGEHGFRFPTSAQIWVNFDKDAFFAEMATANAIAALDSVQVLPHFPQ